MHATRPHSALLPAALAIAVIGCAGSAATPGRAPSSPSAEADDPLRDPEATAQGYGTTMFVAERDASRVWAVVDGESSLLVDDGTLAGIRSLTVLGGRLVAGGKHGVLSIALADGTVSPVAPDVGAVRDVVVDHAGELVLALERGGLVRIHEGQVVPLSDHDAASLQFEPDSRTLLVYASADAEPERLDYLELLGEEAEYWRQRDARPMKTFAVGELELSGAEYWPYRGTEEPNYPEDILWGFYPQHGVVDDGEVATASATPAAVACAEQSYAALQAWTAAVPDAFWEAVGDGRSSRFYLWVNDYSEAAEPWPHEVRPAKFWYWERKPAVVGRVPGYWKWETTLTPDGQCTFPQPEQIEAYLADL
jgi:hypothetical protein